MKLSKVMCCALALVTVGVPLAAEARPLVIGHRGASAYRPEHTLASYELAIDQGADFVEPDIVSTKDGVLIARHENEIGGTTNVGSLAQFADRQTTKVIDGRSITGWFTEDFTLAELKTLRARERIPALRPGNAEFDGQFEVPTLQEVIDLVKQKELETGRTIGIIPETKHPSYFSSIGLPLERRLVDVLSANGYTGEGDAAIIQSFEVGNLQVLNDLTDLRLVQLYGGGQPFDFVLSGDPRTYLDLLTPTGLDFVNDYAQLIGPDKGYIIPRDADGFLLAPTSLVSDAHAAGLLVTPYTFRPENAFLPADFRIGTDPAAFGNLQGELLTYFETGIDGFFVDAPDLGRAAVNAVPEPSSWGMLLLGFGFVGGAIRRRKPGTALATA